MKHTTLNDSDTSYIMTNILDMTYNDHIDLATRHKLKDIYLLLYSNTSEFESKIEKIDNNKLLIAKGYKYGSSYNGCNGWNSWLQDVVIVTSKNENELNQKKLEIERECEKKSDMYVRVSINKWEIVK